MPVNKGTTTRTDKLKVYETVVSGPTSYSTGGFTVTTPLKRILHNEVPIEAIVITPSLASNFVRVIEVVPPTTASPNTFNIKVHQIDVTATAPATWSEVAAGTDLSSMKIRIRAVGV